MKILLVDDNPGFRRMLRAWLAEYAEEVAECEDGESACAVYRRVRPNLTLMDLGLPGVNGLVALGSILADDPDAKVVVLTNHDDDDLRRAARDLGAAAYVLKDRLGELRPIIAAAFTQD